MPGKIGSNSCSIGHPAFSVFSDYSVFHAVCLFKSYAFRSSRQSLALPLNNRYKNVSATMNSHLTYPQKKCFRKKLPPLQLRPPALDILAGEHLPELLPRQMPSADIAVIAVVLAEIIPVFHQSGGQELLPDLRLRVGGDELAVQRVRPQGHQVAEIGLDGLFRILRGSRR